MTPEQLTKEELMLLASMFANAQVAVKDAIPANELLKKMERIINGLGKESHQEDKKDTEKAAA